MNRDIPNFNVGHFISLSKKQSHGATWISFEKWGFNYRLGSWYIDMWKKL